MNASDGAPEASMSTTEVIELVAAWRKVVHGGIESWEINGDPDWWFDHLRGETSRAMAVRDDMDRVIELLGGQVPEDDE